MLATAIFATKNARVRRRWREELKRSFSIHEVSQWETAWRSISALKPKLLILDLSLPKIPGVGALKAIQSLNLKTKIVVVSNRRSSREAKEVLIKGASAYCSVDLKSPELKEVTNTLQKGEIWVERSVISGLLKEICSPTQSINHDSPSANCLDCLEGLSGREREITQLVGRGASNKEAANQLKITERTVKAHITSIFRKIGV